MKYLSCIYNRAIVDLEENRKNRTSAFDGFYSLSVSLSLTHIYIRVYLFTYYYLLILSMVFVLQSLCAASEIRLFLL